MQSSVTLRKYKTSERTELSFEKVEDVSVEALRECASSKFKIPLCDLKLVYGGRVLKDGRSVVDYKVVPGCTIFAMDIKPKSSVKEQKSRTGLRGGLMNNRRMLSLIGRVMSNPAVLQDVVQGMGMATGNPAMLQILANPQLLASLSDPDNIQQYIQDNPDMAAMMEQVIHQVFGSSLEGVAGSEDEDHLVDLLEGHLEEEMAQAEREREEGEMEMAQEQMFEHSQALHAHNQQQMHQGHAPSTSSAAGTASSVQETSYNPLTSQQQGTVVRQGSGSGSVITQNQLSSALANAFGSTSSGSPWLGPSPTSSLTTQPPQVPPVPHSTPLQRFSSSNSGSEMDGAVGGVSRPGPISAASLQQALASVAQGTGPPAPQVARGDQLASMYQSQLEQLRMMGIQDETACLHALAATGGDVQAALDILYSQ